ncbi:MAG TPA: hypothetical protein ENG51_04420 [Deltaproteobacteria bacterium]|nr:MAG: hypothetical protein DRG59_11795 [Deltaproteobacteria bacterium]HDM75698.1 hypothetical protein [Deltaproteobacteria bacterium]HEC31652.1 hypothetical protein [Deltaproteobacteria bacterium]
MDEFLDYLWIKILMIIKYITAFLDALFSPLNAVGPGFAIFVIVCITFAMARFFSRYKTKRLIRLEKEFIHWYNLRQEAMKCEDYEKGKLLAKNVDQAKLNRVYYDYFFERFMVTLLTKYLPIFSMLAYVNEAYKPDNLLKMIGKTYIYKFGKYHGKPIEAGAVFVFFVAYLIVSSGWFVLKFIYSRLRPAKAA